MQKSSRPEDSAVTWLLPGLASFLYAGIFLPLPVQVAPNDKPHSPLTDRNSPVET